MCGFVVIRDEDERIDPQQLAAAGQLLRYRGPDGTSTWVSNDQHVAMSFNRLALVGPIHERQPFSDLERDVHVVVNGEIYGYRAARAALEERGAHFKTQSDCELVLHAYLMFGLKFVEKLNGEFAFVIWDGVTRTLIAARDRWGVKPLFFFADGSRVVCASEIKAILACGVAPRWNRESVYRHVFAAMSPGATLFQNIHQIRPGYIVQLQGDVRKEYCYWNTARQLQYASAATDHDELASELLAALTEAVEDRHQGQQDIACYFSGGLDSSAIAALARRRRSDTVRSFTVDFGSTSEEASHAAAVATELDLSGQVLPVSPTELVDGFEDCVWHAETIGFNAIGVAKLLLSRYARANGCKAILVGDGADELFGGYDFSVLDATCSRSAAHSAHMLEMLERGRRRWAQETGLDLRVHEIPGFSGVEMGIPFLLQSWNYGRCIFGQLFSADFLSHFKDLNPYTRLYEEVVAETGEISGLRRSMALWQKSLFVSHILAGERLDMANSIETRFPFLDNRVADVAARVPDPLLVRNGEEKYLLRRSLETVLPRSVCRTVKRPFQAPPVSALQNTRFSSYLQDVVGSRALRESSIFNPSAVHALVDRWTTLPAAAQERLDTTMMIILSVSALQKRYSLQ